MVLLASLLGPPVLAQDTPIAWSAPADCAAQSEIVRRVAAIVDPARWPADLHARGRVAADRGGYRLDLTVDLAGRRAARSLVSKSCETLAVTAAWLIAVSMDPNLALSAHARERDAARESSAATSASAADSTQAMGESTTASAQPTKDERAASPSAVQEPATGSAAADGAPVARPAKPRSRLALWGRAAVFTGVWGASLPGPQASLGARTGLGLAHAYLELRGAHMFARARRGPLGLVEVDSQELAIAGCAQWGNRLRGGPCLTLSAMRTHARMRGARNRDDDAIFWAGAGAGANLAYVVYVPFELHAEAGLSLPISARPRFQVRAAGEVERASFFVGYAQLSVCVRIE